IEALPTDIPESITHDVTAMEIGESIMLSAVTPPTGVTILGELDAIVVATLSPPRLQAEAEPEIESETGVVGEEAAGEQPPGTEGATGGEE
ncbi:MAG: hypothetical protein FWD42_08750, partial [Solirubrobacterales bacterium]|nr:hypothetical protein [Solirubrobacterales bacterium]